MKVVDKHGRGYERGQLAIFAYSHGETIEIVRDPEHVKLPARHEILALNWSDPVPDTYDPPRDAKGRPVCVGDVMTLSTARRTVTSVNVATGLVRFNTDIIDAALGSLCTLLRFAGEDQDIGEGESEWTLHLDTPSIADYQHASGAVIQHNKMLGNWSWFRVGMQRSGPLAPTRDEAERLALGQPPATLADVVAGHASLPGAVPTTQHEDGAPAKERASAIAPQTEQARRVQQYAALRAAVETACPAGCRVVVDRLHPVTGRASYGDALVILTSGQRATERPFWDYGGEWVDEEDVTPECWIRETVEAWDREAGERLRRGK